MHKNPEILNEYKLTTAYPKKWHHSTEFIQKPWVMKAVKY